MTVKAIKGFNDILPNATGDSRPSSEWRYLESELEAVLDQFGFEQIRLPMLEETPYLCVRLAIILILLKKRCIAF